MVPGFFAYSLVWIHFRYSTSVAILPRVIDSEISVVEGGLVSESSIVWRVNSAMFFSPEDDSALVFGAWQFEGFETFTLENIELPFEGFSVRVAGKPPVVPEPGTAIMVGIGVGLLAFRRR